MVYKNAKLFYYTRVFQSSREFTQLTTDIYTKLT